MEAIEQLQEKAIVHPSLKEQASATHRIETGPSSGLKAMPDPRITGLRPSQALAGRGLSVEPAHKLPCLPVLQIQCEGPCAGHPVPTAFCTGPWGRRMWLSCRKLTKMVLVVETAMILSKGHPYPTPKGKQPFTYMYFDSLFFYFLCLVPPTFLQS